MSDEDYFENEIKSIEFDINSLKRKKEKLTFLKEVPFLQVGDEFQDQ